MPFFTEARKNEPGSGAQTTASFERFLIWFSSLAT